MEMNAAVFRNKYFVDHSIFFYLLLISLSVNVSVQVEFFNKDKLMKGC